MLLYKAFVRATGFYATNVGYLNAIANKILEKYETPLHMLIQMDPYMILRTGI